MLRVRVIAVSVTGECYSFMQQIGKEHPRVLTVSVTRADGRIECSSVNSVPPATNLADRA